MAVRKKQIRALVDKIFLDRNIGAPGKPIDVEAIVKSYGIDIRKDNVKDELSGFLVRNSKNGKAVIGVNRRHHPNRQRFTIAHELGHYLLHEGEVVHFDGARPGLMVNLRSESSAAGDSDLEREANLFAAELLMPARFLEADERINSIDLLDDDPAVLKELASEYCVSSQALTYRLANLGLIDQD